HPDSGRRKHPARAYVSPRPRLRLPVGHRMCTRLRAERPGACQRSAARRCNRLVPPRCSRRLSRMISSDPAAEISELSSTLASVEGVLDPGSMRREADGLREQAANPGLWEDQERAQVVTRRLSYLDGELTRLDGLRRRLDDTRVMF